MHAHSALSTLVRQLAKDLDALDFHTPSHVYNPMLYAWSGYQQFLQRYGEKKGRILLLGMNPGPWGMAQTGIPFGNITAVRDWFGIATQLTPPLPEQHPKYPILGMACHRDEGSGKRLWAWAADRFGSADAFFEHFFVWNYCPLLFLAQDRNMIPSSLSASERQPLEKLCSNALAQAVDILQPAAIMALGRYAEKQAQSVLGDSVAVHYLLHPSPANPKANKHWVEIADQTLAPWLAPPQGQNASP